MFQNKYGKRILGSLCLTAKRIDSLVWKGIAAQTNLVANGVGRNVVNGKNMRFWFDKCLGNFRFWDFRLSDLDENIKGEKDN